MSVKISALPSATALTGPELLAVVQGGVTSKTPASSFALNANSGGTLGTRGGWIGASFTQNAFETGNERGQTWFSPDGLSWDWVPGFHNYSPPTTGDGIRDCSVFIWYPNGPTGNRLYMMASTVSKSGGLQNYFDIATSPDFRNWTHTASVTVPGASGGVAGPKFFVDPASSHLYLIFGFNSAIQYIQCTDTVGVTWNTSGMTAFTGTLTGMANPQLLYLGGTYYMQYWTTGTSSGLGYYATASSFGGSYTEIGLHPATSGVTGDQATWFGQALNGNFIAFTNPDSGSFSGLPCYALSTNFLSGWSALAPYPSPTSPGAGTSDGVNKYPMNPLYGNQGFSFVAIDDVGTYLDAVGAQIAQLLDIPSGLYGVYAGQLITNGNKRFTNKLYTGTGTVSVSGTAVTGSGTLFTQFLTQGSKFSPTGGSIGIVKTVTSNTSVTLYNPGTTVSGAAWAYAHPLLALYNDSGSNSGGGGFIVDGNGGIILLGGGALTLGDNTNATFTRLLNDGTETAILNGNSYLFEVVTSTGDIQANIGNFANNTVGKSYKIKGGSNAVSGTFTLVGGTATVASTAITNGMVILVTLKTASGTRAGNPDIVPTAGTGFVATSTSILDTSVYNWVAISGNN